MDAKGAVGLGTELLGKGPVPARRPGRSGMPAGTGAEGAREVNTALLTAGRGSRRCDVVFPTGKEGDQTVLIIEFQSTAKDSDADRFLDYSAQLI
jgi:hypothetical protein